MPPMGMAIWRSCDFSYTRGFIADLEGTRGFQTIAQAVGILAEASRHASMERVHEGPVEPWSQIATSTMARRGHRFHPTSGTAAG